jgi:hypothetical protein
VAIANSVKAKTERALSSVGSGGGMRMQKGGAGQIAMQAHDIAVQAQMGTNALQIFAQQGSQIASIFGPSGAVVGGIAAIAGALVFAGQKGNEAFAELVTSSQNFNDSLQKTVASGSISQMSDLLGQVADKQRQVADEAAGLATSVKSLAMGVLGTFTGGPSASERKAQLDNAAVALEQVRATLLREAVDLSDRQLEITLARLRGDEQGAAQLERQMKLEREILSIRQSALPTDEQDKLISNAKAAAAAEERAAAAAERAAEAKARAAARGGMNQARAAVDQFDETEAERLNRLMAERDELQRAMESARGDEVRQMEAAQALAEKDLSILEQRKKMEEAVTAERKKQADAAVSAFNAEASAQSAKKEASTAIERTAATSRADAEKELEILRMRVAGQDRKSVV